MQNELKDICDKLEGFRANSKVPEWEVLNAESYGDGENRVWKLTIRQGRDYEAEEQEKNDADK